MRIAVFSDVHGNLAALQAVLNHIDQQDPPVEQIIFAGDLCLFGPRPYECLNLIEQRQIGSVFGNTDEWIPQPPAIPEEASTEERQRRQQIHELCQWTSEQLGPMGLAWLRTLPFHRRISPTVYAKDDLLIVHANPLDVNQIIFPAEADQKERYGRVRQPDNELTPLLKEIATGIIIYGHIHVPGIRQWQNIQLVNVSSVSLPGDDDPRAKYGLFTWARETGWTIEHHRVDYPVEAEIEAFTERKPPGWETAVANLKESGAIPQRI
jgi:predicted phosphodiesterase